MGGAAGLLEILIEPTLLLRLPFHGTCTNTTRTLRLPIPCKPRLELCVLATQTLLLTKNVTTLCVRGAILCEGSRVDQQV